MSVDNMSAQIDSSESKECYFPSDSGSFLIMHTVVTRGVNLGRDTLAGIDITLLLECCYSKITSYDDEEELLPTSEEFDRNEEVAEENNYCLIHEHVMNDECHRIQALLSAWSMVIHIHTCTPMVTKAMLMPLEELEGVQPDMEVPKESSVKKLEEIVKYMLDDGDTEALDILQLIDDIQHLGLGYRFRESTKCALNKIKCSEKMKEKMYNSIHTCSLYFTLLRQHGYEVSADIFENFKDHNGNFKESLSQDVVGMLSLYEASHFAYNEEKILDEARKFTSMKLKEMLGKIDMKIGEQVRHALEIPFQWRMQRLEARWDINALQHLPDYMKMCFLVLYNTVNNMAYDVLKEQGHVIFPQLTKVAEIERGETANAISCYMHENGVSEEVAREYLTSLIDENWKMMNKELVSNFVFDKSFIEIAINLARIAQCHYQCGNAHSDPNDVSKNRVFSVIIDPIQLKIQQPICKN
ncbi:Isoprene synthase [Forsythia ovata]|uniref:Isoprene synthase n=1 Tax=Forsythia ovata TaxID=205694 RepID=A0ABD1WDW3_9LAMI